MNQTLKKIWNMVSTVLVAGIVLCTVFLVGARLLGYRVYTVISGSMEPEYKVGDLLYVKDTDVNTIEVGDPITFILNEDLVVATHRVVRVDAENHRFYTKGDANEIEDGDPVHFNNVIGVPVFSVPKLGYVSDFVQNPPGMYITIGMGLALIMFVFFPDILGKKQKKKNSSPSVMDEGELDAEAGQKEPEGCSEGLEHLSPEVKEPWFEEDATESMVAE